MSGGGGTQQVSQTTTQNLSPQQQEIMGLVMPGLRDFAANPPKFPSGPLTAGFDPSQTAGQNQALDAAGGQTALGQAGAAATQRNLSSDFLNPSSNPAVQDWMKAADQPIQQNLTDSTLPALRSEFAQGGMYGSSRQGIAEGIASRGASQATGATNANIANEGYKTNVDAMMKSLGLLPQTQDALTRGAVTTSGVGDVRQAMAQGGIDEATQRQLYNQFQPLLTANDLASIGSGLPGGGATTVATGPKSGGLSGTLGNALGGFSLGSALFPGAGPVAGGVGAGLAALLSFL